MNCGIISKQHGGDDAAADADIYVRYLFMHQICYSQISVIIVLIMEIKFYPSQFALESVLVYLTIRKIGHQIENNLSFFKSLSFVNNINNNSGWF